MALGEQNGRVNEARRSREVVAPRGRLELAHSYFGSSFALPYRGASRAATGRFGRNLFPWKEDRHVND